jgi:putative DNA methylase
MNNENASERLASDGARAPSPVPRAKPALAAYRRNLPHLQVPGKPQFITFVTWKRWLLPEEVRAMVLHHCLHDHGTKYQLHAAVIMPDHVHVLLTPLTDANGDTFGLAEILQAIKSTSARNINRALGRSGRVWQEESFDTMLRSGESIRQKAEYICANPVRAGLAAHEEDYRWIWREWVEGPREDE